jgi:integrase
VRSSTKVLIWQVSLKAIQCWEVTPFHRGQDYFGGCDTLFNIECADSIGDKFAEIAKKAGVEYLHFHDLRHEAISRMFEPKIKAVAV